MSEENKEWDFYKAYAKLDSDSIWRYVDKINERLNISRKDLMEAIHFGCDDKYFEEHPEYKEVRG